MATQTIIDGGKQAITFNNDTEPLAIYVDGELQRNVSFVPQLAQGTGVVSYASEYKKNHIEYEIQGATTQKTYAGTNLFNQDKLLTDSNFTKSEYNGFDCFKVIPENYLHTFALPSLIPSGTKISFSFDVAHPDSKGSVYIYVVYEDTTEKSFISYDNTPSTVVDFVHITGSIVATQNVTSIKFAFFERFTYRPYYFKNFMLNIGEEKSYEPYVGGIPSPNPEYPQPIENANNGIPLPEGYQQVEYIESTGTQYIDTGFKPNQNTKVEVKSQYISTSSVSIFGSNPYFVLTTVSGKYRFRYNSATRDTSVSGTELAKLTLDKNKAYLNDGLVGTFTEATFQSPYNALLFARSTEGGGVEEKCPAKLYYAKLWDNNVLIRDYVPCYRKSDNVIGLYDLVTKVFYTNQGTGEFIKGADVTNIGMSVTLHGDNFREEIAIPASVDITNTDGTTTTVQLPFSIYDKLTVDRVANEVIYHQGAGYRELRGTETFGTFTTNGEITRFTISPSRLGFKRLSGDGYCSHFIVGETIYLGNDPKDWSVGANKLITFVYDANSVEAFKSWLAAQYAAGTPVTILAEYTEVNPIDITNTTLGQSLLNLDTQNQTNYIEVTGNANAPETPIKLTYAKWGELVENNGNT